MFDFFFFFLLDILTFTPFYPHFLRNDNGELQSDQLISSNSTMFWLFQSPQPCIKQPLLSLKKLIFHKSRTVCTVNTSKIFRQNFVAARRSIRPFLPEQCGRKESRRWKESSWRLLLENSLISTVVGACRINFTTIKGRRPALFPVSPECFYLFSIFNSCCYCSGGVCKASCRKIDLTRESRERPKILSPGWSPFLPRTTRAGRKISKLRSAAFDECYDEG